MPLETVDYTMKVPKEGKEVVDASAAIVKHFINGGNVATAALLLPAVMKAVDGVSGVGAEMKSEYKDELAGYTVHKLWDSLEKDAPEVSPAE